MSAPLAPVGRLAPSPTGFLHLGHARTFLLAWWHIRARGGRIVLRIEDLDRARVRPGMIEAAIEDLAWLGLDWDGPIRIQSEGEEHLRAAVDELVRRELAYPCTCTRKELDAVLSAPHLEDGTQRYPGTCRGRYRSIEEARAHTGRPAALRFRVPPTPLALVDGIAGPFEADVQREVGDFAITSRDGQVSYQLAVVVDDARDGVTEVLRGDDLLSSTARQALLQDALSLARPAWYHAPLVVDTSGRRFAKRTDALALANLRARGVPPEAVVAWAARSAGQPCDRLIRPVDLLPTFDLARLPRAPAILDPSTLAALFASRR